MKRACLPPLLILTLSCVLSPAQAATAPQPPTVLGTVPLTGVLVFQEGYAHTLLFDVSEVN